MALLFSKGNKQRKLKCYKTPMKFNKYYSAFRSILIDGVVFGNYKLSSKQVLPKVIKDYNSTDMEAKRKVQWYKDYLLYPYGFYLEISHKTKKRTIYAGKNINHYILLVLALQDVLLLGQEKPPFVFNVPVKNRNELTDLIRYINAKYKYNLTLSDCNNGEVCLKNGGITLTSSDKISYLVVYLFICIQLENITKTFDPTSAWGELINTKNETMIVHKGGVLTYVKRVPTLLGNAKLHPYYKYVDEFVFNTGCLTIMGGRSLDSI